jgi:hypothetical protein
MDTEGACDGMIVVSGLPRSGTTFVAEVLAEISGKRMCYEPFNVELLQHGKDYPGACAAEFAEYCAKYDRYRNRYEGHNDEPPDPAFDLPAIIEAYQRMHAAYSPTPCIHKIMFWQYWGAMRHIWPDCKIVYVRRRLQSWLACIVRSSNGEAYPDFKGVLGWLNSPYWPQMGPSEKANAPPPWLALGEYWAEDGDDAGRKPLYVAAAYWTLSSEAQLRTLAWETDGDCLVVDYEALTANYEVEAVRLFDYCGIECAPETVGRFLRQPRRSWAGIAPFGAMDVAIVAERVKDFGPRAD